MSRKNDGKDNLVCSFCGMPHDHAERFIMGTPDSKAYICDQCIELCYDMMIQQDEAEEALFLNDFAGELGFGESRKNTRNKKTETVFKCLKPIEIRNFLDEYVIGQVDAKKALSVAVYNHYKRINLLDNIKENEIEIQKSNILVIGPTGVGKTFLAQTLAKMLDVPFAIADATALTEAGYVGEDVENILLRLIQSAGGDIKKAERGIIYIDEIDKVSRRSDNPSITRDVSGEGVQQALLKILEGTIASVPPQGGRKHPHQEFLTIDTSNILFICGGAFDGLEKIIETRQNKKIIGFGSSEKKNEKQVKETLKSLQTQDLHKYGLIPELIGRLPVVVTLDNLDEEALIDILSKPKNSLLKQYVHLFELDDVYLEFSEEALKAIAKEALDRKTGARGLRAIMEGFMRDIMYEIPSDETIEKVVITEDAVKNISKPEITYNPDRKPIKKKTVKPKANKPAS